MSLPKVIGLTGKAQSGKSTSAKILHEGYGYIPVSFADPLKDMICVLLECSRDDLENPEFKEAVIPWLGKSPRQLMQTLGTEWGRNLVHPDLWTILAMRKVDQIDRVVIVDCRFENEADAIRERGHLVHILRDDTPEVAAHISEAGVSVRPNDYGVLNNSTERDLEATWVKLMEQQLMERGEEL